MRLLLRVTRDFSTSSCLFAITISTFEGQVGVVRFAFMHLQQASAYSCWAHALIVYAVGMLDCDHLFGDALVDDLQALYTSGRLSVGWGGRIGRGIEHRRRLVGRHHTTVLGMMQNTHECCRHVPVIGRSTIH